MAELVLSDADLDALADRLADRLGPRLEAFLAGRQAAPEPGPPYLTIEQAAEYLGCSSRQRVDDLLSSGKLTRIKEGRRTLVERAEIERMLQREPARGVAPLRPH